MQRNKFLQKHKLITHKIIILEHQSFKLFNLQAPIQLLQ